MSTVVNMMTLSYPYYTLILPAKDDLVSRMAGMMTGYAMIPGRGTSFKGKKVRKIQVMTCFRLYSLQHGPIFGLY